VCARVCSCVRVCARARVCTLAQFREDRERERPVRAMQRKGAMVRGRLGKGQGQERGRGWVRGERSTVLTGALPLYLITCIHMYMYICIQTNLSPGSIGMILVLSGCCALVKEHLCVCTPQSFPTSSPPLPLSLTGNHTSVSGFKPTIRWSPRALACRKAL